MTIRVIVEVPDIDEANELVDYLGDNMGLLAEVESD